MKLPDRRIIRFIRRHHVLTLATSAGNRPWCAHCFYAYMEDLQTLVFTSEEATRHIREGEEQPMISGGIVLETNIIGRIRGIQLEGELAEPQDLLFQKARKAYLVRFPYAILMDTKIWVVYLTSVKMTDNRLGFGKKIYWQRDDFEGIK